MTTTTLHVDFVSESAGYRNTFGWYNRKTGQGGILFANVEAEGRHTPLTPGVSSVEFTVNTADLGDIEYFLIPDGADRNKRSELDDPIKVIQLADGSWAVARADANGNVIKKNGKPDILDGQGANAFFTEKSKNEGGVDHASSTVGKNQTAATLAGDTADGPAGLIAWEDLAATRKKGAWTAPGDADYNDAVFRVSLVNHQPDIGNDDATVSGDGATTINVLGNDTDPDGEPLRVSAISADGVLGTVTIAPGGTGIIFDPGSAYEFLAAGESRIETVDYTVSDASGGIDTGTVAITVTGANDAPAITSGVQSGAVTELPDRSELENIATHTAEGTVTFADVDATDTHTATFTAQGGGYGGTFALGNLNNTTDSVGWTFEVDDADLDGLAAGQVLTQLYDVTISDGHGGSATQTVTVTLTGASDVPNQAPVIHVITAAFEPLFIDLNNSLPIGLRLFATRFHANGINDLGEVVGEGAFSLFPSAPLEAWSLRLDDPVNSFSKFRIGDGDTSARAINNAGLVGGYFGDTDTRSAYFEDNGPFSTLTLGAHDITVIEGINDAGVTVGYVGSSEADGEFVGFIRTGFATFTWLDWPGSTPGQNYTVANDINNLGQVVGTTTATKGSNERGFIYDNGAFTTFAHGSDRTFAQGINDAGQIVGYYIDGNGFSHGFLYEDGAFLPAASFPVLLTEIQDINNNGVIVGSAVDGRFGMSFVAFLAQPFTYSEDQGQVLISGISITDPDIDPLASGPDSQVQVTLTVGHGTLELAGPTGLAGDLDGSDGTLSFTGDLSAINEQLATILFYQSDPNYFGPDALRVTVIDRGHPGAGGLQSAMREINLTITPVDDPLVISGDTSALVVEDNKLFDSGDLDVTDVDGPNDAWQEVVTRTLSANGYGSYTIDATGHWTYTLDNTNPTVQALNATDFESHPFDTLDDSFTVYTADGTPVVVSATIRGTREEVNVAPEIHIGAATLSTTSEDVSLAIRGITVTDANEEPLGPDRKPTITVSVEHGTLRMNPVAMSLNGNGTDTLVLSSATFLVLGGNLAISLTYTPDPDYAGFDALTITARDNDDTRIGGPLSSSATMTLTITPVDDPLVISGDTSALVVEDNKLFDSGDLDSTDVDGTNDVWQEVTASAATANGYGTYTIDATGHWTYTLDNTNPTVQALDATDFQSHPFDTLDDSFTVYTADGTPVVVSATIRGTREEVNVAPVIHIGAATQSTTSEDVLLPIRGITVTDANEEPLGPDRKPTITVSVEHGTLGFRFPPVAMTLNGNGTDTLVLSSATFLVLGGNLANSLTYTPDPDYVGSDTLTITARDNDDTRIGGPLSSSTTMTLTITPVNDPAVIGGDTSGSVTEDGTLIATGDLDSSDIDSPDDVWQAVTTAAASTKGYGSYTVDATGHWAYTLDNTNPAVQALNPAQGLQDTFTALTEDGTSAVVSVIIRGAVEEEEVNEAPVIHVNTAAPAFLFSLFMFLPGDVRPFADSLRPTGINDLGEIVGEGAFSSPVETAPLQAWSALLEPGGLISGFSKYSLGNGDTGARAINNAGLVGGYYDNSANTRSGYLEDNGVFTKPITLGLHDITVIDGINDNGIRVGYVGSSEADAEFVGFIAAGDTITWLDLQGSTPGQNYTVANDINNLGQVVGTTTATKGSNERGFIYGNGAFTTFAHGSDRTFAQGINDAGQIVGYYIGGDGTSHGFIYEDGGFLPTSSRLSEFSEIQDINNAGTMVGMSGSSDPRFANPLVLRLGQPFTYQEDESANIRGISITDPDIDPLASGPDSQVRVTLTVGHGTLELAGPTGLAGDLDGSDGTLSFAGDLSAINEQLATILSYQSDSNYFGPDILRVTVDDLGNSGAGGPRSAERVIDLTITPVDDPAFLTGDQSGNVTEDGTLVATGDLDVTDADIPDDAWQAVTTPAASMGGYGSYTVDATGHWAYTLDNDSPAVQALAAGQMLFDSLRVVTADGDAFFVPVITINGADDPLQQSTLINNDWLALL